MNPFTPASAVHSGSDEASLSADTLLSVHDAARVLNVTPSWVYEHVRAGAHDRLPHMKLGKFLRFHVSDLAAYIDARRAAATRHRPR